MLALQKIVASFVSMPGLLLLLWGFVTLYLIFRAREKYIKVISILLLGLMFVLFSGFGVRFLLFPLENYLSDQSFFYDHNYPVIVLGGGIHYGLPDKKGELSSQSLQRLVSGYQLYRKVNSQILYTGGVAISHSELSEAKLAYDWLNDMGVAESDIIKEDRAKTTYENAFYVGRWLDKVGRKPKVYLVTSAVHMPRSIAVFNKQGIEVIPFKAGYLYSHDMGWLDYLPNRSALQANLSAVHEWLGLIWYHYNDKI